MDYSAAGVVVSSIWFTVRIVLEQPSGIYLFSGAIGLGDWLALIIGVVGLGSLIEDMLS